MGGRRGADAAGTGAVAFGAGVLFRRVARRLFTGRLAAPRPPSVALLHRSGVADAWFDGFLDRLAAELEARGCTVRRNLFEPAPEVILLGALGPDDSLLGPLRAPRTAPVIGLLDDSAGGEAVTAQARFAVHRELDDCTLVPSIDALTALRQRGPVPRRMLVFAPALETPLAAAPAAESEVCTVLPGDACAAGRVAQAQAAGRATLYPADSHYAYLVWFGGLAYADAAELPQHLETVRAHAALFRRLVLAPGLDVFAERLLRLAALCRELDGETPPDRQTAG